MPSEAAIESEIQAKGLNAPRLTPELIDAQVFYFLCGRASELFKNTPENRDVALPEAFSCLTICVMVLKNGFTIVGKSACASPENFDAELGNKIAYADARQQIWALEGYNLRSRLSQ